MRCCLGLGGLLGVSLGACAAPVEVPAGGYVEVVLPAPATTDGLADIRVADVPVAEFAVDADGAVTALVQGSPLRGKADVVYTYADGSEEVLRNAVEVIGSDEPVLERVVAVGASLTMGVQGGIPSRHGQLHAPTLQVAQALGAYHPMPLLIDPLLEPITASDLGPAPACEVPGVTGHIASQVPRLVTLLAAETGRATYEQARVTPGLTPYNVAVGGSNVSAIVDGVTPGQADELVTGGLVYGGDRIFGTRPEGNQLDMITDIGPTLILNTDFYGNDIIGAILSREVIDETLLTPEDELGANMDRVVEALAGTGAEVFLPTLPRPTLLPATAGATRKEIAAAREQALEDGEDPDAAEAATAADIEARIAVILDRWRFGEERLRSLADQYDNVHVVELAAETELLAQEPPTLAGEDLSLGKLGGLLSTDDLHFSDTGYAFTARVILRALEDELGVSYTPVDLEAVYRGDPYSAPALRTAGVDPADCTP